MKEQKRTRAPARFSFRNWRNADSETMPLGEVAVVRLMFLNQDIVAAPDRGEESYRQRTGYRQSQLLLSFLGELLGAERLRLR
jgi:hypothetical protein